ncbi:MAG: tRNA lysidine(34) synthetase TilS [Planctomycetota bacterium]|nr:tRNA lysidine(34) synthetase TilS [Planctomycetota bacterium]
MPSFLDELRAGVFRCEMPGKRVLVGVSGGADSVALLRGLLALSRDANLQLHVGHFDHCLRDASAGDAEWVRELAETHATPCDSTSATPFSRAEESARDLRYAYFGSAAVRMRCEVVALAHTVDDQAETVLHHIIRGTGLPGLCGIPERRPLSASVAVVRPMRSVTREQVLAYLQEVGQDYRIDETNQDVQYTRNRIRHQLLPQLRTDFNGNVDSALYGLAEQAAAVVAWMDDLADEYLARSLITTDSTCRLDCRELKSLKPILVRHMLVRLWSRLNWPRKRMGSADWSRLAALVQTENAVENLPGNIDARRRGHLLVLRRVDQT